MNYNIVDGENEKIRSVSFEDIEKIVKETYETKMEESSENSNSYEDELLCAQMDYEVNYLKNFLIQL